MFTMLRHVLSLYRYVFLTCVSCSQIMSAKNGGETPLPPWSANVSIYQTPLLTLSADVSICPAPSFRLVSLISICPAPLILMTKKIPRNYNDSLNLQNFLDQFEKDHVSSVLSSFVWAPPPFVSQCHHLPDTSSPLCQPIPAFTKHPPPPSVADISCEHTLRHK